MDTSKIVGEKIKSLRESKSISREEMSERSGLAVEQIERIENNVDLPSLAPLIKIARVLGVRLGTFLDDQAETGPAICRHAGGNDTISFSNNAIQSRKHMEYHALAKSKADRHTEPFIIDVAPTDDNDFVLSTHEGEEFGFVGILLLYAAFGVLIFFGIRTAARSKDLFGFLTASGITAVYAIQVVLNALVVSGSVPPTGLPLPLISAGNTSLIITMASMGILFNISRAGRRAR